MVRVIFCCLYMFTALMPSAQARSIEQTVEVVTTLPLMQRLLSDHVLQGANARVSLLPSSSDDPHSFSYSPRQIELLLGSDVLVVFDEQILETGLQKLLNQYRGNIIRITDLDAAILPSQVNAATPDPHFWLSPATTRQVMLSLGQALSIEFPTLTQAIASNRTALDAEFAMLQTNLTSLKGFAAIPYHDAYQYVTNALRADAPPVIAKSHHLPVSVRQFEVVSKYVAADKIGCILNEPQSNSAQLKAFAREHNLLLQPFDPSGAKAQSYNAFIQELIEKLSACYAHANRQ